MPGDASQQSESAKATSEARRKAMLEPVYRFSLSWRAPNGQMFVGQFAHRAPTVADQMAVDQQVGVAQAAAAGYLEGSGRYLAVMVAHLQRTLTERPSWAQDLTNLPYIDLLTAVAEEAMAHCNTFCDAGSSEGASGALAEGRPRPAPPVVQPTL